MSRRTTAPAADGELVLEPRTCELHGHSMSYIEAGEGPAVLLVHGIACDWKNWREVVGPLARNHTVIAPDLPGHGASASNLGDYSVGGLAAGLRDLLVALGRDSATVVGHSLGGGIAMQFAYQFPERTERLALISSGGLGREVSPALRAAALPGADPFIAATGTAVAAARTALGGLLRRPLSVDQSELVRAYASLAEGRRRRAFLTTVRTAVGIRGQQVAALDRLYLAEALPVQIVWGSEDPIIPLHHGVEAQRAISGSRLEVFAGVRHFPQLEEPERLVGVLERFIEETEPASVDPEQWRALLSARFAEVEAGPSKRSK